MWSAKGAVSTLGAWLYDIGSVDVFLLYVGWGVLMRELSSLTSGMLLFLKRHDWGDSGVHGVLV
jgi:hypothetical protein